MSDSVPPLDGVDPAVDHLQVVRYPDGVVEVVLSNPERRNAMSAAMTSAWERVMRGLAQDREARVVLVRGEGGVFSSGGDTGWIGSEPDASVADLRERMLAFYRTWLSIRAVPVPTVALVQGHAVGAGACVALACDVRVGTPSARFSVPFTALGMHAGMAATWLLPQAVGLPMARDLLLTGRTLRGEELREAGVVTRFEDDEQAVEEARAVARAIAATAPVASRLTVAALREGAPASFESAVQWEGLAQPITLATDDLREGLAAARDRRPPHFSGR